MKKLSLFLILVFLTTIFLMPAHSAIKKLAQTGLQFLEIDLSTRAAAMGGAFMMVGEDADAMFYNPAGIAYMESNVDFTACRTQWIADISYNSGGIVKNFGNIGNFGISFVTSDYGDIIGTRVSSSEQGFEETGNLDVGAYALGISYARSLTNKFTVGGQVKYVAQHLGSNLFPNGDTVENKVSSTAFDFGTMFYPGFKSFRFGMSIRNFSPELKYQQTGFQLPLTFTVGFAMDILDLLGEHNNSLLLAIDAVHPRDYTERIHLGAEYTLLNMIALRAGYKFNYDEEGLTAGLGLNSDLGGLKIKIGYTYSDFGVFDSVSRMSFGVAF